MSSPYKKAALRLVLATLMVAVWVFWFDGPLWAWAILVIYGVFTFALAHMIQSKLAEIQARANTGKDTQS